MTSVGSEPIIVDPSLVLVGEVSVGPPGVGSGVVAVPIESTFAGFEYTQTTPAAVWGDGSPPVIAHNLGRYPAAWSLHDADGRECAEYVVQHLDPDTLRVAMDVPTAGLIRFI